MKIITHAVIQHGVCVYGAGDSPEAACADAALWLEIDGRADDDGEQPTAATVELRCAAATGVLGKLRLIARADDAEEFDGYLWSQGCYHLTADGWVYAGTEADDAELQP